MSFFDQTDLCPFNLNKNLYQWFWTQKHNFKLSSQKLQHTENLFIKVMLNKSSIATAMQVLFRFLLIYLTRWSIMSQNHVLCWQHYVIDVRSMTMFLLDVLWWQILPILSVVLYHSVNWSHPMPHPLQA